MLAEYLVARTIGDVSSQPRSTWEPWDVLTPAGVKVEVKSGAYVQSWAQKRRSPIRFGIAPSVAPDETQGYKGPARRHADVYVMCVLHTANRRGIDPMDLDQWSLFVLSARAIDEACGKRNQSPSADLVAWARRPSISTGSRPPLQMQPSAELLRPMLRVPGGKHSPPILALLRVRDAASSVGESGEVTTGNLSSGLVRLVLDPQFAVFERLANRPNLFRIVGRTFTETWHSMLLAWLLDPRGSHGLGDFALRRLLLAAADEAAFGPEEKRALVMSVAAFGELDDVAVVPNERDPKEVVIRVGDRQRRLDVLVSGIRSPRTPLAEAVLIVEQKVFAPPDTGPGASTVLSMTSILAVLLLGFVLGMRHATDADHVVAVTTIVSQQRSVRAAGLIGAVWGVGHTLTLVLAGGAIILFSIVIPPRLGLSMEFSVAFMLVLLGVINLPGAMKRIEEIAHAHPDAAAKPRPELGSLQLARSLAIGVVHGLAGSAAVALLVLTTIRDPRWALICLLLFGGGTILGMMLLTSLIALPFALAAERFAEVSRRMVQVTSLVSIGLGLFLAYKIGIADGLFSATPHWTPD